jgi:hypothetical protein
MLRGINMRTSIRTLTLVIATSMCILGCTGLLNRASSSYEDEVDVSTVEGKENVAVIRGSTGTILLVSWDCWISNPVETKQLIVDPGIVSITFSCDATLNPVKSLSFTFEALAGHTYRYKVFSDCEGIVDANTGEIVAGCGKYR